MPRLEAQNMSFLTNFLFYIASLLPDFPLYFTSKEAMPTNGSLNFHSPDNPKGEIVGAFLGLGRTTIE